MIGYAIDLGTSSSKAFSLFSKLQMEFNEALSSASFGGKIECVIALRVSGEMTDFGFTGCDRVSYTKRPSRLTVDIGIPSSWEKSSESEIRLLVVDSSKEAVAMMDEYFASEEAGVVSKTDLAEVKALLASLGECA